LKLSRNKDLSLFSTFAIGGKAFFFIEVFDFLEMKKAFAFAREKNLPFFVLGKGSNVLFDDKGFKGVVIKNNIDFVTQDRQSFVVGGGASLTHFAKTCANLQLRGLEFAFGIPATIGGAIFMNASAKDISISNNLESVIFMYENGKVEEIEKEKMSFDYRYSSFQNVKGAIVAARFKFEKDEKAYNNLQKWYQRRKESQPLDSKSLGCIFRNPKNLSAGQLIEESGLKNTKKGNAVVSSMHANFILNESNATSKDVKELIDYIKKVVEEKKHVKLQEEIRILSYE